MAKKTKKTTKKTTYTHKERLNAPGHKGNANQNHVKIPPHPCWNSYHQEQQVLAKMWGKRNPHALLVGM
jgi:hypothetical protein